MTGREGSAPGGRMTALVLPATVVAKALERSERRAAVVAARAARPPPDHEASGVVSAAHPAANTAGARIPSELWRLCWL